MEHSIAKNGSSITIIISGKFTFADNNAYRGLLEHFKDDAVQSVLINTNALEFVDSAALGMFLLAREVAEKHGVALSLTLPQQEQPRKMFQVSRFGDIFTIVEA